MPTPIEPSADLFNRTRGSFMARGSSLNAWCVDQGLTYSWVRQCLIGKRRGEAAARMVQRVTKEAGLLR